MFRRRKKAEPAKLPEVRNDTLDATRARLNDLIAHAESRLDDVLARLTSREYDLKGSK